MEKKPKKEKLTASQDKPENVSSRETDQLNFCFLVEVYDWDMTDYDDAEKG
jgi:hypothetical protein